MRKSALILVAGGMLAAGAHADWMLNDYATVTADSTATNATYGIQTYQNASSAVTISVPGGYVSMKATTIASDPTGTYTANIGMLHPLTPDWSVYDLTGLVSVDFEFKNSDKITDYFAVSFGSTAYSDDISKAGTVYEYAIKGTANLAAGTAWKTASADVASFATPSWWTDIPADFPMIEDVVKEIKNLQFAPKTTYSGTGVGATMTKQTLDIRNVTMVGVSKYQKKNPDMLGCDGTEKFVLDNLFDDNVNEAGGYWFNFSDFDSTAAGTDPAKGSTSSSYSTLAGDDFASGNITLHAILNKMIGTKYQKYSGWAAIGTSFEGDGYLTSAFITGIKFNLKADSLPASVEGINFKAALKGISDTATHIYYAPAANVKTGEDFCARPEDLVQAGYVAAADRSDFDPALGIKQLAWEAKINDDKTPSIYTGQVKLSISNIEIYGISSVDGIIIGGTGVSRKLASRPFSVAYANGALSLKGFDGVSSVDVLSIDGRKVASFAPQASVSLNLSRGTYFLSAKKNGATTVQSFAVISR